MTLKELEAELRAHALGFPETTEDFPWGHSAFKVRGKTFVFMGGDEGRLSLSVKLPHSREFALALPYTEPTHYGLGKSGWVSAAFEQPEAVEMDRLRHWIAESYRAIAPKKLAALVPATVNR